MAFTRRAEIELAASNKRLRTDLRQAESDIGSFGRRASGKLSGAFKGALGGFAAFGTIGGFASLGKDVLAFEEKLTRIGIQAGASRTDLDSLRKTVDEVSLATGLSRTEVLGAVDSLVNLQGRAGFAADKMTVLARAAQATQSPVAELAGVAFALDNAFKISSASDLEGSLNAVISAGKAGAVPLSEMSTVLQQIGSNFAKVSASGKEGAAQLSAAIQVGRKGFGSASEVGTGIKAFTDQLESAAPALARFGVKVLKTGKGGKKEFREIGEILDAFSKSTLMKDPTKLSRVFGSSEARQFLRVMIENRAEFEKYTAEAMDANDIQKDLTTFLDSNAGKMTTSLAAARAELEGLITPERIDTFVSVVEKLVHVLEFVIDHLEETVMLVGALKVAQLAAATHKWGQAMMGVATQARSAADGITGAGTAATSMGKGMSGLVGGFARIASHAAGIASALTAGYQLGTMLVDASGIFADKTLTTATADDPQAKASEAAIKLGQSNDTIAELEKKRGSLNSLKHRKMRTGMGPEMDYDAKIAETESDLAFERQQREIAQNELAAQTIFQRNKARGTNANDDIVTELAAGRTNEMLGRIGSGFGAGPGVADSGIIKEFAPEIGGMSDKQRGQVQARLQALLAEDTAAQERRRALDAKVSGTNPTDLAAIAEAVKAGIEAANVQVRVNGDAVFTANQNSMAPRRAP